MNNSVKALFDFIINDKDFKQLNVDIEKRFEAIKENITSYLLDKEYNDISWFKHNDFIFDLDSIYLDFKNYE